MTQQPQQTTDPHRQQRRLLAVCFAFGIITLGAIVIAVRATVERDRVYTELDSTTVHLQQIRSQSARCQADRESMVRLLTMLAEQSLDSTTLRDVLPDEHTRNALMTFIDDHTQRLRGTSILSATLKETESALRSTARAFAEQSAFAQQTLHSQSDSLLRLASEIQLLRHALDSTSAQLASRMQPYQKLTFTKNGARVTYIGDVLDGMANGFGTGLWNTGGVYEGQWYNNMRHGQGIYVWADGERYEGSFINGKRSGYGVYTFKNGERYLGEWLDDKRHGKGVHLRANGDTVVVGTWVADRFKERQRAPLHAD
jgi:hypothetical protein